MMCFTVVYSPVYKDFHPEPDEASSHTHTTSILRSTLILSSHLSLDVPQGNLNNISRTFNNISHNAPKYFVASKYVS